MERHFAALYPADARFDEIKKLLGFIQAGNVSQILGVPGVGRTIFLSLLVYNSEVKKLHLKERAGEYHFVLVDFTALKDESIVEVGRTILLSIFTSLKERTLLDEAAFVENIFQENSVESHPVTVFQGVHKALDYLAHEKGLSVVLMLDAFEVYAPFLDPKLLSYITALRDHMRYKLSIVFSLNRPLEQSVDSELLADANQLISGHTIWLSLSDAVSNEFVRGFLSKQLAKSVDEKLYRIILQTAGGHAKLVKVAIEESLQNTISESDFLAFVQENRAIRSVNYEIWNSLHADEQLALKDIVGGKGIVVDSAAFAYLTDAHLLTGEFVYTISLFRDFVAYRVEHLQHHAFSYRKDTHDILRGDEIITENFTASEFRLISYLLERASQIITRDDLIDATWKHEKSTAGVSEQALDQLLYRVRKKIEEDPNNPKHLITIKGRGIKLVP
jgi:DNA-binding winged helix-turn-helix (wHTH) protein